MNALFYQMYFQLKSPYQFGVNDLPFSIPYKLFYLFYERLKTIYFFHKRLYFKGNIN